MSFWKLAIVCLVVFTVSADIDTDLELYDDFVKERLELLSASIGGGARAGGVSSSIGRSSGSSSIGKTSGPISRPSAPTSKSSGPISKPSAPTSKPSAPISKHSAPTSKPSTPISKPATSNKKASAPISKPSAPTSKPSAPTSKPSTPISKPSAPISKPATPINKPVTPKDKPVTPINKPVTPKDKPVTPKDKPVTPKDKPITPKDKPVTPKDKPSTPINKPTTPSTPSTPSTKPVTSPTTSSGSVANNQAYIKQLWNLENGAKEGFNSKTGKWTGNAAPEKGGNTDYGPGLKLPYKKGGYTQAQIDKAVTDKITGIEGTLRKNVEGLGKNYDKLSDTQKKLLVDYSYNTGDSFSTFPKFSKAVVEGDVKTMNAEYKRYWVDKSGTRQEVQERNDWTKSVIDSFGK